MFNTVQNKIFSKSVLLAAVLWVFTLVFITLIPTANVKAQESEQVQLEFFYSQTCSHCRAGNSFLDSIQPLYKDLEIIRYNVSNQENVELLRQKLEATGDQRYFGSVPITFIGDNKPILGFGDAQTTGSVMISQIERELSGDESVPVEEAEEGSRSINVPIFGYVDSSSFSLPVLAVLLGLLDGFNVCSLGALILILGLVMSLKDRRLIMIYGGTFIATTAIIYGLLIIGWYKLFEALAPFITYLELFIAAIALAGGAYFIKEFIRIRRVGPTCKTGDTRLVSNASKWLQKQFEERKSIFSMIVAILAFASVITIVEFPCSAAVPVVFAGVLVDYGVSTLVYLALIGIFVLFYMLDELIIYLISVRKMELWLSSPTLSKWFALGEGLILSGIGLYYLLSLIL